VFDFGYDADENAYIVMELLEGESLRTRLNRVKLPELAVVVSVAKQIARAMGAAHAQHIVHRDLKPDNVFLVSDPEMALGFRVKVLDFGVAKLGLDANASAVLTKNGALLGTPLYMSPEQCRGLGDVDLRADIYALGCILYEMVCGHPPFNTGGMGMIVSSHIYVPVPPPRAIVPTLDPVLEAVLLRALAKEPSERYQTMQELAADLSHVPC
jgi:serine/threonine protein kinase